MYLEVALNLPIDKTFTYTVSPELETKVEAGKRVLVPLAKRRVIGYIVNLHSKKPDGYEVKPVLDVLDEEAVFDSQMLKLTRWIASYYLCGWGEVLEAALPSGLNSPQVKPKRVTLISLSRSKEEILSYPLTLRQRRIVEILSVQEQLSLSDLAQKAETSSSPIQSLIKKGFLKQTSQEIKRDPTRGNIFERSFPLVPTSSQAEAIATLHNSINQGRFGAFLIHGITGSGKTEVYLQAINYALKRGKSAIVLVSEISLTPQTIERFKSRFQSQIAVFHSKLSDGERYDEWQRMHQGEATICVGARSAIFAPLKNLGLIVVDEEHETSYKQSETNPKYNARDVAVMRAKLCEAVVILGSATPSLESYYNSKTGKYTLLQLPERIDNRSLPEVKIVDMREETRAKNYSIFSQVLKDSINQKLEQCEQVIIFLNRRGFSTFIQCRECGVAISCINCDITLTYHLDDKSLRCHYCNYSQPAPRQCPHCKGTNIGYFGSGTQRVEEEIQRLFPTAKVCRMDMDTTTKKRSHESILSQFKSGQIDILVGTQMIAKGLDFPKVTLVGVVSADVGLNLPDFRAAERTFSLLTQVAGRAGRGASPGLVIVQTYNPQHYAILAAQEHDYQSFYAKEILFRQELNYPPFTRLVNLTLKSKVEQEVKKGMAEIAGMIKEGGVAPSLTVLGPAPCALSRIKGEYRWQILLKGKDTKKMRELVERISAFQKQELSIDVDPIGML